MADTHHQTKLSLQKSIEALADANRLFPGNKNARITDTSHISYQHKSLPPQVGLYPFGTTRLILPILLLIFFIVIMQFTGNQVSNAAVVISVAIFFLIFFTLKYCWQRFGKQADLIINNKGIQYLEFFYPWNTILTTHLEEVDYPGEENSQELYLLIGLSSGELKTLNITNLNFRNAMVKELSIKKLAAYIEQYKNNCNLQ